MVKEKLSNICIIYFVAAKINNTLGTFLLSYPYYERSAKREASSHCLEEKMLVLAAQHGQSRHDTAQ